MKKTFIEGTAEEILDRPRRTRQCRVLIPDPVPDTALPCPYPEYR
ncbi:hypothetical protein QUB25_08695 [Microcoleus sp. B3-D7]